jgi:hypothetical protein
MSTLNVDKVDPSSGTALELGTSGDTITVPTGAGLTVVDEVKTNKVSPATGTAFALGDSGDTFTVPSGATIVNSGTATGFGITASSFRPNVNPLIINGDMAIAQRLTSLASVSSGANWVTDRYSFNIGTAGTWTLTQEALTADEAFEDGFSTAFKADNTTANGSLSAGSYIQFHQKIEAQDLQLLKSGQSTAEKVTISFWVKATKTGINIIEIWVSDNSRAISVAYTVDTTNTWEKKIIDIPADTAGTGIDNNNSAGWTVIWWMAAGTDNTSGTLRTAWASNAVSANRAVGQVNNADSTSNNFHITGVQLEVGEYTSSTIPPFQHESYGDNLARCQRYYVMIVDGSVASEGTIAMGYCHATNSNYFAAATTPTTMRIGNPSMDGVDATGYWKAYRDNGADAFDNINMYGQGAFTNFSITGDGNVSATVGEGCQIRLNSSSNYFALDAEI